MTPAFDPLVWEENPEKVGCRVREIDISHISVSWSLSCCWSPHFLHPLWRAQVPGTISETMTEITSVVHVGIAIPKGLTRRLPDWDAADRIACHRWGG
jgi:hypothetical protein